VSAPDVFELPPETRRQLKAEAHRLGPLARDLGFTAEITARLIAGLPVQRGTLALARERLALRATSDIGDALSPDLVPHLSAAGAFCIASPDNGERIGVADGRNGWYGLHGWC